MIRLRGRVRRLEEQAGATDSGKSVVAILEGLSRDLVAIGGEIALPMQHWPARDDLERQAAGNDTLATVAAARLRLWGWSIP